MKDGYPWAYAVRLEVAKMARFPIGVAMSEDQLYAAMLIPHICNAVQLPTCGYCHVVRPDSAMFRPLFSEERLAYLKILFEIVKTGHNIDKFRISAMCAECIMSWLNRYSDGNRRRDIRGVWLKLKENGCTDVSAANALFRVPYRLYARTGWLWPGRLWSKCVRATVCVKHLLRQTNCLK